jgi:hypothetical protein
MARANPNPTTKFSTLSQASRRAFVVGAASTALVPAAVASSPPAADLQLVSMAQEIADLQVQLDECNKACNRTFDEFVRLRPERPRSLLWQITDPVGYGDRYRAEDGRTYMWCNFADIRKLRGKVYRQWAFLGNTEQWKALGLEPGDDLKFPVVGHEHLFESWPDPHADKRAAELLEALDRYDAAKDAAYTASGLKAAEAENERLCSQQGQIFLRMIEIQPTTIEGYRAQARALVINCWSGTIEDSDTADKKMIARMMTNLTGLPIVDDEEAR